MIPPSDPRLLARHMLPASVVFRPEPATGVRRTIDPEATCSSISRSAGERAR